MNGNFKYEYSKQRKFSGYDGLFSKKYLHLIECFNCFQQRCKAFNNARTLTILQRNLVDRLEAKESFIIFIYNKLEEKGLTK